MSAGTAKKTKAKEGAICLAFLSMSRSIQPFRATCRAIPTTET
jgi:hypothetical protein